MTSDCGLTRPHGFNCLNVSLPWDPEQSIDVFVFNLLNVSVNILGGNIIIVGILSSLICVFVFSYHRLTIRTTNHLLLLNAATDIIYLTLQGSATILISHNRQGRQSQIMRECFYAIANSIQTFRNWTTVVIASERVCLLCYPIYFKAKWTHRRVFRVIVSLAIATIVLRSMSFLILGFKFSGLCSVAEKLFCTDALIDIVFLISLPMFLLFIFSLRIFEELRRLQGSRGYLDIASFHKRRLGHRQGEWRIHRTLLTVLVLFTILSIPYLPNAILRILEVTSVGGCQVFLWQKITSVVAYTGTLLNSTFNFFLYLICWPRFRAIVWLELSKPCVAMMSCTRKHCTQKKQLQQV